MKPDKVELVKQFEFNLPTAFAGDYYEVAVKVQMIEPTEIADIIIVDYHLQSGNEMEDMDDFAEELLKAAIYEQHGDDIVESCFECWEMV